MNSTPDSRRDALEIAISWTEARGGAQAATSTDLVKAAAIIESYLTGGLQVRVVGSDVDENGSRLPVNDSNGLGVNAGDVFPVDDVGSVGVGIHKTVSDALDQPLSGKLVNRHEASSFAQGGEKPERGATLSGNETVAARCSCELCRRVHGSRDGERA